MTVNEFLQYMTPDALVSTAVGSYTFYDDESLNVARLCFAQLVGLVGADDAVELIESEMGDFAIAFLEVVS